MSNRTCSYKMSDAVYAAVPQEAVGALVEDAALSALERNKDLSGDALVRLYFVVVDGEPTLLTTSLIEDGGQLHCYVALWSEMRGHLQVPSSGPAKG